MATKRDRQATTTVTVEREVREYRVYCGCCDCMWLVGTCEGWFKLLEWISTFLAFVIICARLAKYDLTFLPEYNFMVFVGVTAFVFITIHIILKLTHLFEKLPVVLTHPYVGVFCCLLAVVAFLSASSVVLAHAKNKAGLGSLEASAACGYIAMFLFLFEALYLFCRVRRQQNGQETTATGSTKTVETVQKVETKESTDKTANKERLSEFPP